MRASFGLLVVGAAFAIGCGSVTSVDHDGGAGMGGGAAGANGGPGGGSAGSSAAGSGGGGSGSGGSGVAGQAGGGAGRGGSAGGATGVGGGAAGRGGNAGGVAGAGGGAGRGGSAGGVAGAGGASGRGGSGGLAGIGGVGGAAGGFNCPRGGCPALMLSDVTDIDMSGVPAFNALGFRCKALAVCGAAASCVYYANDTLGYAHSMDAYQDGAEAAVPVAAKLRLQAGAASQCNDPAISIGAGQSMGLMFDGRKLTVYFPSFTGSELTLYVSSDGSTYYDATMLQAAALRP